MKTHILLTALLLSPLVSLHSADKPDTSRWKEDFSDEAAFLKNWGAYGMTPDGKWTSGPGSMHLWWQIQDGSLRGQHAPKTHGSGLQHAVSGKDVRLSLRFKLPAGGASYIGFNGPNPILGFNFHLAFVKITKTSIEALDEDVLFPKESQEAAELKKNGKANRKPFIGMTEKIALSPDDWHHLTFETRAKTLTVFIDGKQALTYETKAGDAPKMTAQFSLSGNGKDIGFGWYDDISFEPLEAKK
jgi:hypothetical protein